LIVDEEGEISHETETVEGGLPVDLARGKRLHTLSDATRPLPDFPWYRKQPELHSLLAIRAGPQHVCVLDHAEPEHFDSHRQGLARAFAEQMAQWLTFTRQLAELDRNSGLLQRFYDASKSLSQDLQVEQILQEILRYCREVSRFEMCSICLMEEGEDKFTVAVAEGFPEGIRGKTLPLGTDNWAGWILCKREEPLAINLRRGTGMPILDAREKLVDNTSFLGLPLRAKNRYCGVLLMTRKGKPFSSDELEVLKNLCNLASVAIENARVYERTERLAATDSLTGLFNRRYFRRALERELSRGERGKGNVALIIMDIDHFKKLNDTYGHPRGDVVLKKIAEILQKVLRKGDVLARYGGEEFVILLPEASRQGTKDFAERVRKAVSSTPIHPGGPRKKVTLSVGWALYPEDTEEMEELMELADRALYFAKDTGRNRAAGAYLLKPDADD